MIAVRTAKAAIHGGFGQNLVFCTLRPAIMSSVFVASRCARFVIEYRQHYSPDAVASGRRLFSYASIELNPEEIAT
jgi:hypothetical protein